MSTYVLLVDIREKGKTDMNAARKNMEELVEFIQKLGGNIKSNFMTLGRHDAVEIVELPGDEEALKASMKATESGAVNVETLKAFNEEELRKMFQQ